MTKTYNDIDMVTHLLAEVGMYLFFLEYKKLKLKKPWESIKIAYQMKNDDVCARINDSPTGIPMSNGS